MTTSPGNVPTHWPDMLRAFRLTLEQGRPAVNQHLQCKYLTDDGLRCAVGHLIPAGHEALGCRTGVVHLFERFPDALPESCRTREAVSDLYRLQSAHDIAAELPNFPAAFRKAVRTRLPDFYTWMETQDEN